MEAVDLRGVFLPRIAQYSRENDPSSPPEWMTFDLDTLPQTGTGNAWMIGALDDHDAWIVTSSTPWVSYHEWIRGALALAPDVDRPDPGADPDHDGLSNLWEYHTGHFH